MQPVERLRVGDLVLAPSGRAVAIAGIATRLLQPDSIAIDPDCRPVRIRAGAIDTMLPTRDLVLAPGQCVGIAGGIATACDLVNGVSVLRDPAGAEAVCYVQLRLDAEADAVLAEGVECGIAGWRAGAGMVRIAAPLGFTPGPLIGNIARADHSGVAGWAMDELHPTVPVALEVIADGGVIALALADRRRPDLEMAGLGDGRCGFAIRFVCPLPASRDQVLQVRRAEDAAAVPGSPLLLRRPQAAPEALAAMPQPGADAAALAQGIERLLQARADRGA